MIKNKAIVGSYEGGHRSYTSSSCEEQAILNAHEILVKVSACNIYKIQQDVMIDLLSRVQNFALSPSSCVTGEVIDVGLNVITIKAKDFVVGFIPLDSTRSGCAIYCIVNDFDAVVLPRNVDLMQVVATIGAGMKAFYALQYLAKISIFDTILILDATSAMGSLCVQLAKIWGAKVLAVASKDDKLYLENLSHPPDHVIEMESLSGNLSSIVIKETGGLGANVIIDNGVKLFSNEEDSLVAKDDTSSWKPLKLEIISCLASNGRWITSNPLLQIDPADSLQLFLLGASVNFLFEHLWSLAPTSQGKFLHIARDLVSKLGSQMIEPPKTKVISFEDFLENGLDIDEVDQTIISISKE